MSITIYKYAYHVGWDSTGIAVSARSSGGGGAPVDLSNYYTIQQLQTPDLSNVNFANITDAYHNEMLGLQGGKVVTDSSDTPSSEGDNEFYHLDFDIYSRVITWEFLDSLIEESDGVIHLVNDSVAPGNSKYYGTDIVGEKGWYNLPSFVGYVNVSGTPINNQIAIWVDEDTIEGSTELSYDGRTFIFGGYPIDVPDVSHTTISIGTILSDYVNANYCIFIGYETGVSITGGIRNIGIGSNALYYNTTGSDNTAIGTFSLQENGIGNYNTGIGQGSLYANTTANCNTAIGVSALFSITTGSNNVGIGYKAGMSTIFYNSQNNGFSNNSIYIGGYTTALTAYDINEIVIGYDAAGQGSNTTVIGNYDTIGTYLAGEIYFITYVERSIGSATTGSLPLADSSITQVVMYDPDTGKLYYGAGAGGDISYTFGMSLSEDSTGTVTLDNDSVAPGNSKYYGTDGNGVKGWFDLPSGGGSAVDSTLLDWSTDRYQPYALQQAGGELYTDQNTIPDEVNYLGYNGTLGVHSLYSMVRLDVGLSTSGVASTSWHVNMFGLTETYLGSVVKCRFNPAVDSYPSFDAYMFDTTEALAADKWLFVWKNNSNIVASLDGDGKLYGNNFVYKYIIGNTTLISHDSEQSTISESYIKLKTITLGSNIGINTTLRIRFDLKLDPVGAPPWAYGIIYRNGVAVGTERETGSTSYITYSEDITDWNAGDTVELWVRTYNSEYTAYVKDFRICGSHNSIVNEVTGTIS